MDAHTIYENVLQIKAQLALGNPFGEAVTLVAATKMQDAEIINAAIAAGVDAVAENRVQEFNAKTQLLSPCPQHFIGHLQTNKVKYLVGKIALFHSCDRYDLAQEIARVSLQRGVVSNLLIQVNIGEEATKGGFDYAEARLAYQRIKAMDGVRVKGFMAMLPHSEDEALLTSLAKRMRTLFDEVKAEDSEVEFLSMGMSGDWKLCVACGSNMIRVGSTIFGERNYG